MSTVRELVLESCHDNNISRKSVLQQSRDLGFTVSKHTVAGLQSVGNVSESLSSITALLLSDRMLVAAA